MSITGFDLRGRLKSLAKTVLVKTGTLCEVFLDATGNHSSDPAPDKTLYLRRFRLLRTPWFRVHLHQILVPDSNPELHNHPYAFVSYILSGGYTEQRWTPTLVKNAAQEATMVMGEVPVTWRAGMWNHVELDASHRLSAVLPGTWTLVLGGATKQPWGFFDSHGNFNAHDVTPAMRAQAMAAKMMGNHVGLPPGFVFPSATLG
jgi:hypothetical protein